MLGFVRALCAVIVGLELLILVLLRIKEELLFPSPAIWDVLIVTTALSLVVLLVRAAPTWLVWVAGIVSAGPILLGWGILTVVMAMAGK